MKKMLFSRSWIAALSALLFFAIVSCSGRSDAEIKGDITEKLSSMPEMASVTVDVKDGVVTTGGHVNDEAGKATCESTIKSVKGVKSVTNNVTVAAPVTEAPVTIAADDQLTKGVTDAVKDFDGVTADVNDGVVTLTGTLKRNRLPKLMQSLNTLKPKKINNQLTLK